jgi:hypothetical protein
MALIFYPSSDDLQDPKLEPRLEVLRAAAEEYKAIVLDPTSGIAEEDKKPVIPKDLGSAFNWDEVGRILREIREYPELNREAKTKKSQLLTNLAEIYEVLRGAKMPKLEAVRLALISEANQLRGSSSQVA